MAQKSTVGPTTSGWRAPPGRVAPFFRDHPFLESVASNTASGLIVAFMVVFVASSVAFAAGNLPEGEAIAFLLMLSWMGMLLILAGYALVGTLLLYLFFDRGPIKGRLNLATRQALFLAWVSGNAPHTALLWTHWWWATAPFAAASFVLVVVWPWRVLLRPAEKEDPQQLERFYLWWPVIFGSALALTIMGLAAISATLGLLYESTTG